MSDTEGDSSGSDTDSFTIEQLENMAASDQKKRKAPRAANGTDDSDDDEAPAPPPKKQHKSKAGHDGGSKPRSKAATKPRSAPAKMIAIDPDGKERTFPKTTQVLKSPERPLTYAEFQRKLDGGKLNEEQLAAVCEGITLFKQRSSLLKPKVGWGFLETIAPDQRFLFFVKKPDVTKLVQLLYESLLPDLRPVPFEEFHPVIQDGMNPGKVPPTDLSVFERAVLAGTGYGLPITSTGKRRSPPARAAASAAILPASASGPSAGISLEALANFAASAKARISIHFGNAP